MNRTLIGAFLLSALTALPVVAQEALPPAKIALPSMLSTTSAGKAVDGRPWQYIVWQTGDTAWLRNRVLALYIKPGAADATSTFTPLGTTAVTRDPAALKIYIERARALSDAAKHQLFTDTINDLVERWKTDGQSVPATLEQKLSALVNRTLTSEEDAVTLRQVSTSFPAIRMALGMGWAGPLPVADGSTATIEVREFDPTAQKDLQVVGRVTFLAGRAAPLTAPSGLVQVPDLTPEGNMNVKLRWALPDALRRQNLQSTGFVVWRSDSAGLTNSVRLNRFPIELSKLYTNAEAANFTADPSTFFVMDRGTDGNPSSPGFQTERTCYYAVAALDWLGQSGPVSPVIPGYVVNTIPPPVPSGLGVEEITTGVSGQTQVRLRLTFNGIPVVAGNTLAHRQAIYRGGGNETDSLRKLNQLLPDPELPIPFGETGLNALSVVNNTNGGRIVFNDTGLLPSSAPAGQSFWYSVRSIHDTVLGPIYSAPSPPVFGAFHDREGPQAPEGALGSDGPVTIARYVTSVSALINDGATTLGTGRFMRLTCTRQDKNVRYATFHVTTPATGGDGTIIGDSKKVFFAPNSDIVYSDYFWFEPGPLRGASGVAYDSLNFVCTAFSDMDIPSFRTWTTLDWNNLGGASKTQRTLVNFSAQVIGESQLVTTDPAMSPRLETPAFNSTVTQGTTVTATLSSNAWNGKKAIIRITRSSYSTVYRVAKVTAAATLSFDDPILTIPSAPTATYLTRIRKDIQSPMPPGFAGESWLPAAPEPGHFSFLPDGTAPSLWVNLTLQPQTAEYRIYRQVDGGQLGLISEGNADYLPGQANQIVIEDKPNLPASGVVCYYGQLFDSSGNPSPLKQIGECLKIIADPPVPVLDAPEQLGTAASPQMKVKWFCPKVGVKRFHVRVVDETTGQDLTTATGGTKLSAALTDGFYFNTPTGGPPTINYNGAVFITSANATPAGAVPPAANEPVLHTMTFNVKADRKYTVEAWAESWAGKEGNRSMPQTFIWRSVVPSGSVPWPARPLPPVILGSSLGIVAANFTPQLQASQGPITYYSAEQNPVFVTLGVMPLSATGFTTSRLNLPSGDTEFPVLNADPSSYLYKASRDPNAYLANILDPATLVVKPASNVVLYRQMTATQGRDTTNTADLVQVSPLIQNVSWLPIGGTQAGVVDQNILAIPFHNGTRYTHANLDIADFHPVSDVSTYRYFLVQFDANGEISLTIDAGSVTVPNPTIIEN